MILGDSKAGKTTSIRTLNPKTTVVISPLNKGLPFAGSGKNYTVWSKDKNPTGNIIRTSDSTAIVNWMNYISSKMLDVRVIILDDNTFVTAKALDRRREEKTFDKFTDIAHDFLLLAETANSLREDLNVYILHHVESEGDDILTPKKIKAASYGKMIDQKLHGMESQFEIVFLAVKIVDSDDKIVYKFKTRDANSTCGTPMNMFDEEFIDNDLEAIDQRIRCYYQDCQGEKEIPEELKPKTKQAN